MNFIDYVFLYFLLTLGFSFIKYKKLNLWILLPLPQMLLQLIAMDSQLLNMICDCSRGQIRHSLKEDGINIGYLVLLFSILYIGAFIAYIKRIYRPKVLFFLYHLPFFLGFGFFFFIFAVITYTNFGTLYYIP